MERRNAWRVVAVVVALVLSGCATVAIVDGYRVDEDAWKQDRRKILARAAFEFSCPEEQLVLKVLSTSYGEYAATVGVTGCDKKATYVRVPYTDTWSMDSASADVRPTQASPAR